MAISETLRSFALGAVDWNNRPVALNFGKAQGAVGHLLALQHAHIQEGLMTGIDGHLTCVSARHDLAPQLLLGLPVSVRLVTDRGQVHTVNAIIKDVQIGSSDGELTVYQLSISDALSLMDKRTNSRVFPGHTTETPALAANQSYRITLNDGRVLEGKSDASGLTNLVKDDVMRIAKVDILKPSL